MESTQREVLHENFKYTPLEYQFLDLKKDNPDVLLLIECGNKYRAFGEDAQVVSRVLDMGCSLTHNFFSTSFPTHRFSVHIRRLLAKGYKVGVVKQTESAALKAIGSNKNKLFTRKLHSLYTPSTFIDEGFISVNDCLDTTSISGCLMCISETSSKKDLKIGVVIVNALSGDIFYHVCEGITALAHLENCFSLNNPVEFLLPTTTFNEKTETLIKNYIDVKSASRVKVRVERISNEAFDFSNALRKVSSFIIDDGENKDSSGVQAVLNLDPVIICCLSPLISYLTECRLELLLKNYKQIKPLHSSLYHMSFNASAIRCLELIENLSDHREYGSLLWAINNTRTKFGKKLLITWLLKPLRRLGDITERLDMVDAVLHSDTPLWSIVENMLVKLPDLNRLLCNAFYHRSSVSDFVVLVNAFIGVKICFTTIFERIDLEVDNLSLKNILSHTISMLEDIDHFVKNITDESSRENDKNDIFKDVSKYPKVMEAKLEMERIRNRLTVLKTVIASTLQLSAFNYTSVMGQNYLIEVQNNNLEYVPYDWLKISSTKHVSRYQSPEVIALTEELEVFSEKLTLSCAEAWSNYLKEFSKHFYKYKMVVHNLAVVDCIISFAKIAKISGFSRPILTENQSDRIIVQGRNPIICKLISETGQYVANDFKLKDSECCMIITGPNMGGKSSYVRQIALIWILAQAGSYVPADYVSLPLCDGIYVRMGSEDDLCARRSTFMVEMEETSTILSMATSNSLVILDELGQGTSSNDGAAIAFATLNHLISEIQCTTLFVTHYPQIASSLECLHCNKVINVHLDFLTSNEDIADESSVDEVIFLFSVCPGIASRSYGINVARLVGIPKEILDRAKIKSYEAEMKQLNEFKRN